MGMPLFSMHDAEAFDSANDYMYLLQSHKETEDKRVTLGALRAYFTGAGVRVIEALISSAVARVLTVNVAGDTNVVVLVEGNSTVDTIHLTGHIPVGCSVQVLLIGSSDLTSDHTGITVDGTLSGGSEMLKAKGVALLTQVSATGWYCTILNDASYIKSLIEHDVYVEEQRAAAAEAALQQSIGAETGRAQGVESGLQSEINTAMSEIAATQANIQGETSRAESAEAGLAQQISQAEGTLQGQIDAILADSAYWSTVSGDTITVNGWSAAAASLSIGKFGHLRSINFYFSASVQGSSIPTARTFVTITPTDQTNATFLDFWSKLPTNYTDGQPWMAFCGGSSGISTTAGGPISLSNNVLHLRMRAVTDSSSRKGIELQILSGGNMPNWTEVFDGSPNSGNRTLRFAVTLNYAS